MTCILRQEPRFIRAEAGEVAATWSRAGGGALAVAHADVSAELDVVVRGARAGVAFELRQSSDPTPTLLPLEEGRERVGVRGFWTLLGPDDQILGEAFQDTWLTRHGEIFLSLALRLASGDELSVEYAALDISLAGVEAVELRAESLAGHAGSGKGFLCTWSTARRRTDTVLWKGAVPPFYERWPPLFDQWSLDPETSCWTRLPGGGPFAEDAKDGCARVGLAWIDAAPMAVSPQLDLRGLVWLGLGQATRLEELARANATPLAPFVRGGHLRSYEELDGAYEVVLAGDDCTIEFPSDVDRRPLRVRVFGLQAEGGYASNNDVDLALFSERGRSDDPLVWVDAPAEGRADEALLVAEASAEGSTHLALRRQGGLHLSYQRRDPRRCITVHHPADLERPIATIELASLHLRDIRLPGMVRPALYDMPLHWMRYLPKAAAHMANKLSAVEFLDQSGDAVGLRLHATTPDGAVRSRYTLEIPYRTDEVELRIHAELSGAAFWGLPTFEYADLFPEASIDPSCWEFRRLALLRHGEVRVIEQARPYPGLDSAIEFPQSVLEAMSAAHALPGCGPFSFSATGGVVFEGSPRGTILVIARNPLPGELEHVATLCEHWADVHLDAATPGARPVPSDRQTDVVTSPIPDDIEVDLTIRVLDPARVSFDEALDIARDACDALVGAT